MPRVPRDTDDALRWAESCRSEGDRVPQGTPSPPAPVDRSGLPPSLAERFAPRELLVPGESRSSHPAAVPHDRDRFGVAEICRAKPLDEAMAGSKGDFRCQPEPDRLL